MVIDIRESSFLFDDSSIDTHPKSKLNIILEKLNPDILSFQDARQSCATLGPLASLGES